VTRSSLMWLDEDLNPLGSAADNVAPLPVGTSSEEWLGMRDCPTPGRYFYWKVCADDPNTVAEESEGNNCRREKWWCPSIIITTTSTTSTSSTAPMAYSKTVSLRYRVSDEYHDQAYTCSIWTNVSGVWAINQTQINVKKSVDKTVRLIKVPPGMYGWTVNCSNGSLNFYADNGVHDASGAPAGNKVWIFYV